MFTIQRINYQRSINLNKFIFSLVLTLIATTASAQSVNGIWVFNRAFDIENVSPLPPPVSSTLHINNEQIFFPNNCVINLEQKPYYYHDALQMLLKSGIEEESLNKHISKQFNFSLTNTKVYYRGDAGAGTTCDEFNYKFLVSKETLILVRASAQFYAYHRETSTSNTASTSAAVNSLGSLKATRLPFEPQTYIANCSRFMGRRNGPPQPSKKCAPAFFPYIIGLNSKDPLLKLIGSHNFIKGGASAPSGDYDDPVSQKLHPVVVFLPPFKGVVLVRVDDLEGGDEQRDVMAGAYLAIKNGKVTDQLNEGCSFDENFVCSSKSTPTRYKLLENGKFSQENK